MNNDFMLYVMVASIFGLFGWAGFEYAKAGYQYWKDQRQGQIAAKASGDSPIATSEHRPEEGPPITTTERSNVGGGSN